MMNLMKHLVKQIEGKQIEGKPSMFDVVSGKLYVKHDKIQIIFGVNEYTVIFEWEGEVTHRKSYSMTRAITSGDIITFEGLTGRQEFCISEDSR